jgi:hypothetical protein
MAEIDALKIRMRDSQVFTHNIHFLHISGRCNCNLFAAVIFSCHFIRIICLSNFEKYLILIRESIVSEEN